MTVFTATFILVSYSAVERKVERPEALQKPYFVELQNRERESKKEHPQKVYFSNLPAMRAALRENSRAEGFFTLWHITNNAAGF